MSRSKDVPSFPQAYNDFYKSNGSDTVFNTEGPSLTRQEFMEEADINSIMSRYDGHVIGGPGNLPPMQPMYADFTEVPSSLLDYMQVMERGTDAFMSLPAAVRREFNNDARMFVDFASDPENLPQMRTWGLAPPEKVAPAPPVAAAQGVSPASSAPAPAAAPAGPAGPAGASTHGST